MIGKLKVGNTGLSLLILSGVIGSIFGLVWLALSYPIWFSWVMGVSGFSFLWWVIKITLDDWRGE